MINWLEFALSIFGGAAGGVLIVFGLSRWLGDVWKGKILEKVQQANRKELESLRSEMQASVEKANRLLDAGISKAIIVTRTHFETEFTAYREIFAALSDVKNCIHVTRPVLIIAGDEHAVKDEKNLVERLNNLITAHNRTVVLVDNLRPFYRDEIYQAVQDCFNSSKREIFQVKTGGGFQAFSAPWFEEGRKNQEAFSKAYNLVAGLIRDRLASLGVLPQ